MKDPVSITFSTKAKHGLAASILNSEEIPFEYTNDTLSIRVERCNLDMATAVLGIAQIWPITSFHGGPDYTVDNDTPTETALSKDGYGTNVSPGIKADYFKKDLYKLLDAYDIRLMSHPFSDSNPVIYIVNKGTSFADDHAHIAI